MPVDSGSTTHCTAQAATAASMALPPAFSTSIAVWVARVCEVAAMPSVACAGERPGISRFRMSCPFTVPGAPLCGKNFRPRLRMPASSL